MSHRATMVSLHVEAGILLTTVAAQRQRLDIYARLGERNPVTVAFHWHCSVMRAEKEGSLR
jgi:hypothetical protein